MIASGGPYIQGLCSLEVHAKAGFVTDVTESPRSGEMTVVMVVNSVHDLHDNSNGNDRTELHVRQHHCGCKTSRRIWKNWGTTHRQGHSKLNRKRIAVVNATQLKETEQELGKRSKPDKQAEIVLPSTGSVTLNPEP